MTFHLRLAAMALLAPAGLWAQWASEPGTTACTVNVYLTDLDPRGTAVRSEPRLDASQIFRIPPMWPLEGNPGGDMIGAELEVTGSRNGWLLVHTATFRDPSKPADEGTFSGPGWVWGGIAAVQLADIDLKTEPRSDAPAAFNLQNPTTGKQVYPVKIMSILGCQGKFIQVLVSVPGGKQVQGWSEYHCTAQLTTCDVDRAHSPASFDCKKAKTRAEKMVCGDGDLGAMDQNVATELQTVLDMIPWKQTLRRQHAEWLAEHRDKAPDVETMKNLYNRRFDELVNLNKVEAETRMPVDASAAARGCIAVRREKDETCKVEEAGALGEGYQYQLQSYYTGDLRVNGAVMVLTSIDMNEGRLRPVAWAQGDTAHFSKPEIIASQSGKLLALDAHMDGTGNFSMGTLYRQVEGRWQEVDIESWKRDLAARLPKGRAVLKGIYPDWHKMTADTPLWRTGDGNCCPQGGSAHATLALRGDKIVLTGVRVSDKVVE